MGERKYMKTDQTLYLSGIHSGIEMITSSGYWSFISPSISCQYNPQPDITAYELAQILPYLHGKIMYEKDWQNLGNAARHLRRM